jgi:hypothetical protein
LRTKQQLGYIVQLTLGHNLIYLLKIWSFSMWWNHLSASFEGKFMVFGVSGLHLIVPNFKIFCHQLGNRICYGSRSNMEGRRFQKLRLLAGVPNCGNLIVFGFALAHWHNMQGMQVRHFFFALQGQTTWLRQNIVRKR